MKTKQNSKFQRSKSLLPPPSQPLNKIDNLRRIFFEELHISEWKFLIHFFKYWGCQKSYRIRSHTAQKIEFSVKDFLRKFPADLATFTEEILDEKLFVVQCQRLKIEDMLYFNRSAHDYLHMSARARCLCAELCNDDISCCCTIFCFAKTYKDQNMKL